MCHAPLRWGEGIENSRARLHEISLVSRNDRQIMNQGGGRDQTILDRHGSPGGTKLGQELGPAQARGSLPLQTMNFLDSLREPAFQ